MAIVKLEDLEDKTLEVQAEEDADLKIVYRRRGSDLVFASTKTSKKVMVSRVSHRFKTAKNYLHDPAVIEENRDSIKRLLNEGGYKLVERVEG